MGQGRVESGRWPSAGDLLLAATAALIVLSLALGGAERSRQLALERREMADRDALAGIAVGVVGDLERSVAAVAATQGTVVPDAAVLGIPRGAPEEPCSATLPPELRDASIELLLRKACDTGDPEVGDPIDIGDGPRIPVAIAHYQQQAGLTGAGARRAAVQGWSVAALDASAILRRHVPRGVVASMTEGDQVLAAGDEPTDELPSQAVEVGGHRLVLRAGDPDPVALTAPTVILVVGGLLAAGLAAAGVVAASHARREQKLERDKALTQVQLVGDVAPLVQQSLDLADVLPAVAVQLGDHFGLAGLRLSSGTTSAGQVELFSLGARPIAATPVLVPPDHLDAGETLNLALQRGGRSVALLQIVAGRPLDDSDLGSLRAITELITAAVVNATLYASQQEAVRRLRELDGLKTVFLSTASHELRTPATAIGGFASLLSGSWDRFDDAQRREFAERIAANARSLGAVVQDLLDFSLLDRGRLHLTIAGVDLGPLVRSVVDRLGPAVPEHEVACTIEEAPPVAADPNALERIITNLMTNAAKFSPPGSTITVGVRPSGEGAAIVVSDQGQGVPLEERERIFTRFYRGSGEAVVKTRGVGIGLSVVAELTDRMGGSITIDDAPGGGARFRVDLPPATAMGQIKELDDASTA